MKSRIKGDRKKNVERLHVALEVKEKSSVSQHLCKHLPVPNSLHSHSQRVIYLIIVVITTQLFIADR